MTHIDRRDFFLKGAAVATATGLAGGSGVVRAMAAATPTAPMAAAPHAFFDGVVRIGAHMVPAVQSGGDDFA